MVAAAADDAGCLWRAVVVGSPWGAIQRRVGVVAAVGHPAPGRRLIVVAAVGPAPGRRCKVAAVGLPVPGRRVVVVAAVGLARGRR